MGDFNKVLSEQLDKRGGITTPSQSSNYINQFLEQEDWLDVWRTFHGNDFQFSWKRKSPLIMTHLDYAFVHLSSIALISTCNILPAYLCDHCPLFLSITQNATFHGPGNWKLNTKHLTDPKYVAEVNKIIDLADYRYETLEPSHKWEMIKLDRVFIVFCEKS